MRSPDGAVQRKLKARHIQMASWFVYADNARIKWCSGCQIAIGGTIGTGLFVGSGSTLHNGGPVGLLLSYVVMGSVVYSMMIALGEMTTLFPVSGSFVGVFCSIQKLTTQIGM